MKDKIDIPTSLNQILIKCPWNYTGIYKICSSINGKIAILCCIINYNLILKLIKITNNFTDYIIIQDNTCKYK